MDFPEAQMIATNGHGSRLEIHTLECGHWIQQEEPGKTNEILLEWLLRKAS